MDPCKNKKETELNWNNKQTQSSGFEVHFRMTFIHSFGIMIIFQHLRDFTLFLHTIFIYLQAEEGAGERAYASGLTCSRVMALLPHMMVARTYSSIK